MQSVPKPLTVWRARIDFYLAPLKTARHPVPAVPETESAALVLLPILALGCGLPAAPWDERRRPDRTRRPLKIIIIIIFWQQTFKMREQRKGRLTCRIPAPGGTEQNGTGRIPAPTLPPSPSRSPAMTAKRGRAGPWLPAEAVSAAGR